MIRELILRWARNRCRQRTTVYLAGPMSGLPDLNFPAFHKAAATLRAHGLEVINPAEVNPDPEMKWEDAMRADIPELCKCQGIALLPGWENSRGAKLEKHIADQLGMQPIYLTNV